MPRNIRIVFTMPRRLLVLGSTACAAATLMSASSEAAYDPPSTKAGDRLSVEEVIEVAYSAGFRSAAQLLSATSLAITESSLLSKIRNWQPQYGYRPAGDRIGVQGPSAAWNGSQQLHSDRGLWQISSRWWPQYSDAQVDDPDQAARIVWTLSNSGTNFSRWDSFESGLAQRPGTGRMTAGPRSGRWSGASSRVAARPRPGRESDVHRQGRRLAVRPRAALYGDGDEWRRIADRNGISNPSSIDAGDVLIIP